MAEAGGGAAAAGGGPQQGSPAAGGVAAAAAGGPARNAAESPGGPGSARTAGKKAQLRAAPRAKKLEKLGVYSACKVPGRERPPAHGGWGLTEGGEEGKAAPGRAGREAARLQPGAPRGSGESGVAVGPAALGASRPAPAAAPRESRRAASALGKVAAPSSRSSRPGPCPPPRPAPASRTARRRSLPPRVALRTTPVPTPAARFWARGSRDPSACCGCGARPVLCCHGAR